MVIGLLGVLGAPVQYLVTVELLQRTGLEPGVVLIQLQNLEDSHAREAAMRLNHVILTSNVQVRGEKHIIYLILFNINL